MNFSQKRRRVRDLTLGKDVEERGPSGPKVETQEEPFEGTGL